MRKWSGFDQPETDFKLGWQRCQCHQKKFRAKGFHWDVTLDESLTAPVFRFSWAVIILDGASKASNRDGWKRVQMVGLTSPKRTSSLGDEDANTTKRSFARKAFNGM